MKKIINFSRSTIIRPFGFMDNYKKKAKDKEYKHFIDFLTSRDQFRLIEYQQFVDDSIDKMNKGIIRKLVGNDEQSSAEMMEARSVLDACFPEELQDYKELKKDSVVKDIQTITGLSEDRIHKVVRGYEGFKAIHNYLQQLKRKEETLPVNYDLLIQKFKREYRKSYKDKQLDHENYLANMESMRKKDSQDRITSKRTAAAIRRRPYRCV